MGTTHSENIDRHVRTYVFVFAALAVLTVLTVAVGYLRLPSVAAVGIGLLIASIKAGLVAAYFMHLISEENVIYYVLAVTGVFLLGMLVLFTTSYVDQVTEAVVP